MKQIIDKAINNRNIRYNELGYCINDYTFGLLSLEEQYKLSLALKKDKNILSKNASFQKLMKKVTSELESQIIANLHSGATYHETDLKNKNDRIKVEMEKEAFIQNAAKKLSKKELAKLQKLLPIKNVY